MNKPYISVVMAVFNAESSLLWAIESVLNQNFDDFEFIIVNDGSSDNSRNIILSYSDSRIKLIDNAQNMGLIYSLNLGVAKSTGKYIARMDADDISYPERFQTQLNFLEVNPNVDLVSCKALVFFDGEHILGTLPFLNTHEKICKQPWRGFFMPHPTWMGKSEWFKRFQYPQVLRAEDQALLLDAYPTSYFASLDKVLLGYKQQPFNFPKTFLARRNLLAYQLVKFLKRHEWGYFVFALLVFILKVVIDLIATVPALKKAFFYRMSNNVRLDEVKSFENLILSLKNNHHA